MKEKNLYWIAGLDLLIVAVCYALNVYLHITNAILSLMFITVGLVTFYGIVRMGISGNDRTLSKYDIRLAIVISLLTMYIVLVGTVSFFKEGGELPPITETIP